LTRPPAIAADYEKAIHRSHRVGWLRAAVLGANDGLISTSSLAVGVAAANSDQAAILLATLAGLVAGALSMAAGEYVSVSSQADTEAADLELERRELREYPDIEKAELAGIYVARGLTPDLATQVAEQLTAYDALAAHARDEHGFHEVSRARPIQAALASAAAFGVGAAPVAVFAAMVAPASLGMVLAASTLILLAVLGATAAGLGGASRTKGAIRVMFWGVVAMLSTAAVGRLFGVASGGL
jgi:VIT1/CCC1 family predicted Fe2+/Mn2+ transporter